MQTQDIKNSPAVAQNEGVMRVKFRDAVSERAASIWDSNREVAGSLNIANTGVFCAHKEFNEQGITTVVNSIPSLKQPKAVLAEMLSIYKAVTASAPACTR